MTYDLRKLRRSIVLPSLFIFALAISAFGQNDDEVVKIDSDLVLVNATVTDKSGAAVSGLRAAQFSVFIDGVEQKFSSFEPEVTPFAAVILLDTSGSMESRVSLARSAAIKFLEELRGSDVAAVYRFDSKVELIQDFSKSRDIVESIFDLKADGMTALNDAVSKAAKALAGRPEKRRAIIVLSDGGDTISKLSSDKALKGANEAGATIYTIDMSSPDLKVAERAQLQGALKKFSDKTGGTFIATPGGPLMRDALNKIALELGNQYTLTVALTDNLTDGKFHSIEVRVAKPNLTIRTRKGFTSPKK